MDSETIRFLRSGDRAVTVEFGNCIDVNINKQVHALAKALEDKKIHGIGESIPTFRSLLVFFDPSIINFEKVTEQIKEILKGLDDAKDYDCKIWKIPCCYGARFGQDLHDLEEYTGLTREEIIKIHSSVDYRIYMMGFLPGFAYLGGLDKRIEMPRLRSPRVKINAGSVGIGGNQTGIYPLASPGGWRLIGGTPVDMYDPDREDPIFCKAGDAIRFVPIHIDEYYDIRDMVRKGTYEISYEFA